MRKATCLLLVLLLVSFNITFIFAAAEGAGGFTGEEVNLSLEDAKTAMLTSGVAIETAEYNLKANKAKTRSYYERYDNLDSLRVASRGLPIEATPSELPSKTMMQMADYAAKFAVVQTPKNYDAEVNKIVRDTVESYYQLARFKEALRVSEENVAIQEKLYKNTQSKFQLGVVSKQDVLTAEIGLNEARVNAEQAAALYAANRMNFNIAFGYELMQNTNITDTLEEVSVSEVPLADAIKAALENRNYIVGAEFSLKLAELNLAETDIRNTKSSAAYQNDATALMGAQNVYDDAPKMVEMDVRTKYTNMHQKKSEVELGKLNVANAKETYRLAMLQYDAGMTTLTDTQQAQLAAYNVELAYYTTLLEFNLAVIDYEQSFTVGTDTVGF